MNRAVFATLLLLCPSMPSAALAHGYVYWPPARAVKCESAPSSGLCAGVPPQVYWNKNDFEGPTGFLWNSNFTVANGGKPAYSSLTQAGQWPANSVQSGTIQFAWNLTAPHDTKGFRYFITKPGWNVWAPLTASSFEPTPFCTAGGFRGAMPDPTRPIAKDERHSCYLPSRRGYHVILAVWDGDYGTNTSFYNVIDVQFPSY